MAVYTWVSNPATPFIYSFDDSLPTIKDQIRSLIGDVNGLPVAYMSDAQITATAAQHGDDLYTSAADCAEACAARCLQIQKSIQQGNRLEGIRIENFDPVKAYDAFINLANTLRDKSTVGNLPSYGVLSGQTTLTRCPINPLPI